MLRKSSLKYSASLAVLLLGLSGQSATAADLTFSDGQTLTGIGAVDGVDSISYADAGGNPIDFTLDAVGTFTIGIDTNSIDGDEGAGVSTNTNVVNLVVGSGGGALDLIVSGNVVADGSSGGAAPDSIRFDYSGSGSHTVTLNGAANHLGTGGEIEFANAADVMNLNGDITLGVIDFQAVDATVNVADGVTITGDIDNLAGAAGIVTFAQDGVITGNIGAGSDIVTLNVGDGGVVELQGTTLNISTTNLTGASGSTLLITTDGTTLNSDIDSDANAAGVLDLDANVTITGATGTTNAANGLATVSIADTKTVDLRGNVQATDVTLEGNSTLLLNNNGLTITSTNGIDGDTANNGTVQASQNATIAGDIGTVNGIATLLVDSTSLLTVSGTTINATAITLDDGTMRLTTDATTVTGAVDSGATQGSLDIDGSTTFAGDIGAGASTIAAVDVANTKTVTFQGTTIEVDTLTLEGSGGSTVQFTTDGTTYTGDITSDFNAEGILDVDGNTTIVGTIGASALADVQIDNTKSLTVQGDLTSTQVTLDGGTLILDSNGMTATIAQGIEGSALNGGTLQVSDNASFSGDIGTTNGVDLVIDSGVTLSYIGNDINANDITIDNGTLSLDTTGTSVAGDINSTLGNEGTIDVNQDTSFTSDIGNLQSLDELTVADNMTATLAGTTIVVSDITLEGAAGSTVSFQTDGTAFTGDINSDGNEAGFLVINGDTTIAGRLGNLQRLASTTINNGDVLTMQGDVDSTIVFLNGGTLVLDSAALTLVTDNLDVDATNGGTLQASADAAVQGAVGQIQPLTDIIVDNGVTLSFNSNVASTAISLDGGTVDFTGITSTITSNIDGSAANGGTIDVSNDTSITGTIGATNGLTAINVDNTVTLGVSGNVTATNISLDGGTFNTTAASTVTGNIAASLINGGDFDVDADTTVAGNIGSVAILDTVDVDAAATLSLSNATTLGATNVTVAGGLTMADTVTLETGTTATFAADSVITIATDSITGTSVTTGNPLFIDADANDATVNFSAGTTNIAFTIGFTGSIDLVDASNGGTLNLNGTTFDTGNVGVLVNATVDTTTNPDVVTLVSVAKEANELAADIDVTESQAASFIAAAATVTAANDPTARAALDTVILSGDAQTQTAAIQLTPDLEAIDSSKEIATASRMNFDNISTRLAAVRTGRSYTDRGLVGRTGIAAGNGIPNDKIWVRGFGQVVDQENQEGLTGYSAEAYGFTVGYDTPIGVDSRVGLAFGYTDTEVDGEGQGENVSEIDSYQLSLYADYTPGNYYLEGMVGYSFNDGHTMSTIDFAGLARQLSGDYTSDQYSTAFEMGYAVPFSDTSRLVPFAGLQYYFVGGQTIKLEDGTAFNQNVAVEDLNMLLGSFGARYEFEIISETGTFSPKFNAGVLYDFVGDDSEASSTYTTSGLAYDIEGADVEKVSFVFGTGLTFITDDGLTEWTMAYDSEFKEDYIAHTGVVKASFKF